MTILSVDIKLFSCIILVWKISCNTHSKKREKFKSNIILKNHRESSKKFNLEENNHPGKF